MFLLMILFLLSAPFCNSNLSDTFVNEILVGEKDRISDFMTNELARQQDFFGMTPLHIAVLRGDYSLVNDIFYIFPAAANMQDKNGCSPVHYAAAATDSRVFNALIIEAQTGFLRNIPEIDYFSLTTRKQTPLHFAATKDVVETLSELNQFDPNAIDDLNNTPLHYAANADVANALLAAGANYKKTNTYGATPLHMAAFEDRIDVLDAILAHIKDKKERVRYVNLKDRIGCTALFYASADGIEHLIQHGALLSGLTRHKANIFHFVKNGAAAQKIFSLGKNDGLNAEDIDGETPLFKAVRKENIDLVLALVKKGANPSYQRIKFAKTPLFLAVESGDLELVKAMGKGIKNAVNAFYISPDNGLAQCPLSGAISSNDIAMARYLIDRGAKIDIVKPPNKRAKLYLVKKAINNYEMLQLLLSRDNPSSKKLKKRVNAPGFYRRTPLHYVENANCAELLIESGANLNAETYGGDLPIHTVNKSDVLDVFLAGGAAVQLDKKNDLGQTPLITYCYKLHDGKTWEDVYNFMSHFLNIYAQAGDKSLESYLKLKDSHGNSVLSLLCDFFGLSTSADVFISLFLNSGSYETFDVEVNHLLEIQNASPQGGE